MRVTDTASFIAKSKIAHGDRYDYSKSFYTKQKDKLEIICPQHGIFKQTPDKHIRGSGCAECAGNIKKDNSYFINKSIGIHGLKYNYSKSKYINVNEDVEIICKEHGSFWQSPSNHYAGKGCFKCAGVASSLRTRKTLNEFLDDANRVHGGRYDYIKDTYRTAKDKMDIICRKHGVFKKSPNKHLLGQGCPCCKKEEFYNSESLESYSARASAIHKNKFIYLRKYSKSTSGKKKSVIEYMCKSHGVVIQSAYGHLNGKGCVRCSRELSGQYSVMTTQEFIEKSRMKHGDRYDYSESVYFRAASKLKIICKKHGVFLQTPNRHTGGSGCKKCSDETPRQGWSRSGFAANCGNRIAKVYLVEMKSDNESFFKIGITCNSVKGRFYNSPYQVKIISHIESSPERVFDIEKEMHRKLRGKKHKPSIPFKGMTECFSELTDEVKEFFGVAA